MSWFIHLQYFNHLFSFSMEEADDALGDSDDEADFSKMDQGNKKGPIGRWDFDTQEEYSDYMANKEALPKYGLSLSSTNLFLIRISVNTGR